MNQFFYWVYDDFENSRIQLPPVAEKIIQEIPKEDENIKTPTTIVDTIKESDFQPESTKVEIC